MKLSAYYRISATRVGKPGRSSVSPVITSRKGLPTVMREPIQLMAKWPIQPKETS